MRKKSFSLLLIAALIVILSAAALAAPALPFTDVPDTAWYSGDIKLAYQNNLINGKSDVLFAPEDSLTYAEAAKLAACMHQRYTTGSVSLQNGEPWYQSYVEYCRDQEIITHDYPWTTQATRAGYMEIFSRALPDEALQPINEIEADSIPDVSKSHPQAAAIYLLYRAGILHGNDEAHNCAPNTGIRRCEVAAILTRMMEPDQRLTFSIDGPSLPAAPQEESPSVPPVDPQIPELELDEDEGPLDFS